MFVLKLLRFLLVILFARWLFVFLRSAIGSSASRSSTTTQNADLVFDSICNTYLPRDRALHAVVGGREQHFCSAECRGRAAALAAAS